MPYKIPSILTICFLTISPTGLSGTSRVPPSVNTR